MIGSWQDLEAEVEKHLKEHQRLSKLAYHRFFDSKSAGSLLPAQPADFLVTYHGATLLIEAKFSGVHDSLRAAFSGAVKAHQLASARIWTRAGAGYFLLFYSAPANSFEVWEGLYCAERRSVGKPLELVKRRVFASLPKALGDMLGHG